MKCFWYLGGLIGFDGHAAKRKTKLLRQPNKERCRVGAHNYRRDQLASPLGAQHIKLIFRLDPDQSNSVLPACLQTSFISPLSSGFWVVGLPRFGGWLSSAKLSDSLRIVNLTN